MKRLLNQLASLKLAVILLVLLLVGLAAGTIIESSRGAPWRSGPSTTRGGSSRCRACSR